MGQLRETNPEARCGENCRFSWEWCYGGKSCLKSDVILTTRLAEKKPNKAKPARRGKC